MSKVIAYCGLVCSDCPTFLATQNDDDEAREKTVALYAQQCGVTFQKEDINCDGCLAGDGRIIGYGRICEIRQCCLGKGLEHCVVCPEQPCEKIDRFHEISQEAKASFEALKKAWGGQGPQ